MIPNFTPDAPEIPFRTFQWYGFFIGGILPIFLFICFQCIGYNEPLLDSNAFGCILTHTIIISIIGVILYDKEPSSTHKKWFGYLFLFQALFSFCLTHLLVASTGGSKSSVFAFTYLYIPSIVGYAYGKGRNLYGASCILFFSYLVNLFYHKEGYSLFENYILIFNKISIKQANELNISHLYLLIFLIQLIVLNVISFKKDMV